MGTWAGRTIRRRAARTVRESAAKLAKALQKMRADQRALARLTRDAERLAAAAR
jgi:hypothetical protein